MIEMCLTPLFPTLFFWAVFAMVLSFHKKIVNLFSSYKSLDFSLNPNPDKEAEVLDFLKEIVRLAEERIKEQNDASRTYERKAVLLATLCLVILGYLLHDFPQGIFSWFPKESLWIHIALWPLIISILFCVQAINFAPYGPLGLHPIVTSGLIDNPDKTSLARTCRHLLGEYAKRINLNEEHNGKKYKSMIIAMVFWAIGTGALLGVICSYLYRMQCVTLASPLCG